jgi:superfamily II DNA or RNA helicase
MNLIQIVRERVKKAALLTDVELQPQQKRVVEKMQKEPALLAYHALGSGKTLSSLAAGEQIKGPKTVVVPAALRENYRKEIAKFTDQPAEAPDYTVSSYNKAISKGLPEAGLTIFDEAHRMGRSGTKISKLPLKAHGKVMFLTGTPVRNDPSEFVPLLKVLGQGRNPPESNKAFREKFVEEVMVRPSWWQATWHGVKPGMVERLRNQGELQRLIKGRVDYHPLQGEFPRVDEQDVAVEMTPEQTKLYEAFLNEDSGLAYKIKKNLPPSKAESPRLNAFLSAVRQLSNNPTTFDKSMQGSAIAHSPKLRRMLGELYKGLATDANFKGVVYSNYLKSGILPLADALERKGIPHAVFTGGLKDSERREIVDNYNSGKVKILLVSGAGSEGLDLKGTKLMQLMEPHWNQARLDQMIGRAVRHRSHAHLPEAERTVKVQRFFSNPAPRLAQRWGLMDKDMGADEYMANLSDTKQQLISQFLDVLKKASGEKAAHVTNLPKRFDIPGNFLESVPKLPRIEKQSKEGTDDFLAIGVRNRQRLRKKDVAKPSGKLWDAVEPDFYQHGDRFVEGELSEEALRQLELGKFKTHKLKQAPPGTSLFSKAKRVGIECPADNRFCGGRMTPVLGVFDVPEGDPEFAGKSIAKLREFAYRAGHHILSNDIKFAEKLLHEHWKGQQGLIGIVRRHKLLTALAALGLPAAGYGTYRLFKKEAKDDYAIGLPDPRRFGDVKQIPPGEVLKWVVQRHIADRAGPHYDVRFGREDGKPSLYSWATRKELPEPGGKIMLYHQPLHYGQYAEFEGEILCVPGETLICCSDGVRPIKNIDPERDEINVFGVGSRGFSFYKVKRLYRNVRRRIWISLKIETASGETRSLLCGREHGIYVVGKGFVSAKNITIGQPVLLEQLSHAHFENFVAGSTQKYEERRVMRLTQHERNKMMNFKVCGSTTGTTALISASYNTSGAFPVFPPDRSSGVETSPTSRFRTTKCFDVVTAKGGFNGFATRAKTRSDLVLSETFVEIKPFDFGCVVERRNGGLSSVLCCASPPVSKVSCDNFSEVCRLVPISVNTGMHRCFCKADSCCGFCNRKSFFEKAYHVSGGNGFSSSHIDDSYINCNMIDKGTVKEVKVIVQETEAFDLLVEDAHNYFANGILVHNSGYGKGSVKKHDYGNVIVTKAERDKIQFVVTHKKFPEFYTMVRMSGPPSQGSAQTRSKQGGSWLMINTTPMSAAKMLDGKPEEVGINKLKYGVVPADKVEKLFDPNYMIQEKVDGASALYHLMGDRIEALSYRISKTGRPIVYTYKIFGPGGAKLNLPKELQGTIVRGEVYGEREGKAIPMQELGGLLNASISNSLQKQKEQKVQMKNMLFDVVRYGKEPIKPNTLTGEERMSKLQEIMKHLPATQFRLPETARTPEEQKALYERIVSEQHPSTREGIVAWPATTPGRAIKVKPRPEHDVWVQNVFPGKGKYEGAAGGFEYSLSPEGPIVGKVGGGFDDPTRKQMMEEAEDWKGRLARVSAMERFPSGAYRNPSFLALHHDYPLAKTSAMLVEANLGRSEHEPTRRESFISGDQSLPRIAARRLRERHQRYF